MPGSPPALWNGYDDADEDDLLGLLEDKVNRALDENDPTVDERATKDFAQAITSHEWLKQKLGDPGYRPRLHARASQVRVGSWRP